MPIGATSRGNDGNTTVVEESLNLNSHTFRPSDPTSQSVIPFPMPPSAYFPFPLMIPRVEAIDIDPADPCDEGPALQEEQWVLQTPLQVDESPPV